jgi:glycosyltransferase involved in cell wall biosynthesis
VRAVLDARTATDHFPGIGRYVAGLSAALGRVAPELDLTLLRDPGAAATRLALPPLPLAGCRVSPFAPAQQWRVPAELRRLQATLYHSAYYLMPYLAGVPTVVTLYDLIPLVWPAYYTATQRLIFRVGHRLALAAARMTLVISEATRQDLARYFRVDPARIAVTPLAADPAMRPPPPGQVSAVLKKYNLPEHYVLYVGSNKPHKNLARMVAAWSELPHLKGGIESSLVIAGHWDARYPEARQLAAERGLAQNVRFLGPVAEMDLPALYGGARLFVFPSLYEGFGLPVLEAMACGAPVLCSNTSSLPEVAGDAAFLVDPQDETAMTAALAQALADEALRMRLRTAGLARAAQFSWDRTAQATLEIYQRVGH